MFLKKNRQTEDTGREKNRRAKKKLHFSLIKNNKTQRETFLY
jgi:hypothetical protein